MRIIHGNRGFLYWVPPEQPASSPGALARACGAGEGGLHPQLRASLEEKEVILSLEELVPSGTMLTALDSLAATAAADAEGLLTRLDAALPAPTERVQLCGQGWFRLRRADWEPMLGWLDRARAGEDPLTLEVVRDAPPEALLAELKPDETGLLALGAAALKHALEQDLDLLEISEQKPGTTLEEFWRRLAAEARQLEAPRPSPARRFCRGLLALLAGDPLLAERELAAASAGGERRADRWLPLARQRALERPRPEPRYLSAEKTEPTPELLAQLAFERESEAEPRKRPWRLLVIALVVLVGAVLLWLLSRAFDRSMQALDQRSTEIEQR